MCGSPGLFRLAAWLAFPVVAAGAVSGDLDVQVRDPKGRPVEGAVVAVYPAEGAPALPPDPPPAIIDQVDEEFVPQVSAVPMGTPVSFPNSDDIRHHVYSFSKPKTFELPLYEGTPTDPVVFDRPGLVVLGCNIHDWMVAYVYVLETPWSGVTGAEGRARIEGLPAGDYRVEALHPRRKGASDPDAPMVRIVEGKTASLGFQMKLKPDLRRTRAPRSGGGDYR
ncbi:MAG: hypothetical protein PVF68_07805 [Acidobacteriota bacterium]